MRMERQQTLVLGGAGLSINAIKEASRVATVVDLSWKPMAGGRGDFQRAAVAAGYARKMRHGQKFYLVAIDFRVEALLRKTVQASKTAGECAA